MCLNHRNHLDPEAFVVGIDSRNSSLVHKVYRL